MYYEIDGIYEMPSVIFEDDCIISGRREFEYSKITSIKITNAIAFSAYAIFKVIYDGKVVSIPFNRHHIKTARHALKELEPRLGKENRESNINSANVESIPYDAIKQLKELYDMQAITEEEFNQKKKELLNL